MFSATQVEPLPPPAEPAPVEPATTAQRLSDRVGCGTLPAVGGSRLLSGDSSSEGRVTDVSRDVLGELQAWYLERCNDDWEHSYGVNIDNLDNPGWRVDVDLAFTPLSDRPYERAETHRSEDDWLVSWREEARWRAACGPLNLSEALAAFLDWSRSP